MTPSSKRTVVIGGVLCLIVLGLIVWAVRPSKHAMGAPSPTPDVEVVQVEQKDVPIYGD